MGAPHSRHLSADLQKPQNDLPAAAIPVAGAEQRQMGTYMILLPAWKNFLSDPGCPPEECLLG